MKPKRIKFAKHDYAYSSLPTTRKEAFKDVYRHNFRTIIACGLTLLLFAIPILVFVFVLEIGKMGMTLEFYTQEELSNVLLMWDIILNVGVVLLLFVFLVGLSGVIRILRLLIWQEGISFWYDFKKGIKENYPMMSLLTGIFTTFYLITYFIQLFFLQFLIGLTLIVIFIVVFISVYLWSIIMSSVYQTRLFSYIKNAFFFTSKTMGWTILFNILISLPFLSYYLYFLSISNMLLFVVLKTILFALMLIFYYPMMIIVALLYSAAKFDQYINKDYYPDYYQKGLYHTKSKHKE